jgi:phospholipid transport system transporter-binding protein
MLLLPAVLTAREAAGALRMLVQALPKAPGAVAVVDASALQTLDSSAIAVLLETRRRAQLGGLGFELRAAPPKLLALARLYGVGELLEVPAAAVGASR